MKSRWRVSRAALGLPVAAVLGCGVLGNALGSAANDAATPPDAVALLRAIEREVGDAACDADAQCHTIAIGAKGCGGPEAYLAWSDMVSCAATLSGLAPRHRAAREAENACSDMVSNCAFVSDPGAVCRPRAGVGGRVCQTDAGADAAGQAR